LAERRSLGVRARIGGGSNKARDAVKGEVGSDTRKNKERSNLMTNTKDSIWSNSENKKEVINHTREGKLTIGSLFAGI